MHQRHRGLISHIFTVHYGRLSSPKFLECEQSVSECHKRADSSCSTTLGCVVFFSCLVVPSSLDLKSACARLAPCTCSVVPQYVSMESPYWMDDGDGDGDGILQADKCWSMQR